MKRTNLIVTTNFTVSGPGTYGVNANNVTIKLPTWTHWVAADADTNSVTIKDITGVPNPNITVLPWPGGTIDGQTSIIISDGFESLTLDPFLGGNTWTVS